MYLDDCMYLDIYNGYKVFGMFSESFCWDVGILDHRRETDGRQVSRWHLLPVVW